jgi:molecular chaperone IbpA
MTQVMKVDTAALNRALIGFDRIFNTMERSWGNSMANNNYPPYNLERKGDIYTITLAVAGFSLDEIDVSVDQDQLIITGEKKPVESEDVEYLHRGLAYRSFERSFALSEHMEVRSADLKNGLLTVVIERIIPEALLPRKIQIKEV